MKVLFLIPAPLNISPSQRFRFEHYLPMLEKNGITYTIQSFWSLRVWNILFNKGHYFLKTIGLLSGLIRRLSIVINLFKYDCVFIHREAAPIGPPFFEWLISKIWRKKIIYDFDDAIWITAASEANPKVAVFKCSWKVKNICRMSCIVSAGNSFLADYAKKYCEDVRVIPTVVDTETKHNRLKDQYEGPLTIGWTGTFTNFYNLKKINTVIIRLKKKYNFRYLIIANKDPKFENIEYIYKQWDVDTEIENLLQMHIGVMPLDNTEMELGKCSFKAIQYMSLGIPAVVSPVGSNCIVIQNNINGFWADSDDEWYDTLERLLTDDSLRQQMGLTSRQRIVDHYSVKTTVDLFISLFTKKGLRK